MTELKDLKDMSEEERKEAVLEFGRKVNDSVGDKVRTGVGWFKKIAGGVLLLIGVIVLFCGAINAGMGIAGAGLAVLGFGIANASVRMKKAISGLGIALVGIAFISYGIGEISKAKESVNWPTVSGTVITSKTEERKSTEGSGSSKKTRTYYVAIIQYEYQVEGTSYTSNRVSFGGQKRGSARTLVNKYPEGKSVKVYYDPDDPEIAALEPGMEGGSYFLPIFGAIIILFGCLIAFKSPKTK
ncbi:MAG: DUF3592 domain-containing protein [Pseudomonadota bacterium]